MTAHITPLVSTPPTSGNASNTLSARLTRPVYERTNKGRFKTVVRFRDYSQLVNAERLGLDDESIFSAVEAGRSRNYAFIFKTLSDFDLFAKYYFEASFPVMANNVESAASTGGATHGGATHGGAADDGSVSDDDSSGAEADADAEAEADAEADADADANSTSSGEEYDAALLDGQSQDIDQLYYISAAKARLQLQSSIEEEEDDDTGGGSDANLSSSSSSSSIKY